MNPFVLVPDRMNARRKVNDAQLAHDRGQRADWGQPGTTMCPGCPDRGAEASSRRASASPLSAFVGSRNSAHNKFTSNKLPIVTATFGQLPSALCDG
jgi:hypothetical protein